MKILGLSRSTFVRSINTAFLFLTASVFSQAAMASFDQVVNDGFRPAAQALSSIIFFSVPAFGTQVPLIVMALVGCGLFFTLYFWVLLP